MPRAEGLWRSHRCDSDIFFSDFALMIHLLVCRQTWAFVLPQGSYIIMLKESF